LKESIQNSNGKKCSPSDNYLHSVQVKGPLSVFFILEATLEVK